MYNSCFNFLREFETQLSYLLFSIFACKTNNTLPKT